MAPKRKAFTSPLGVKPEKKGIKIKDIIVPVLSEDDDDEKGNIGKNKNEKKNEVVGFIRFTRKASLPELLDKKADIQSEIKFDKKRKEQLFGIINIFVSLLIWGQEN